MDAQTTQLLVLTGTLTTLLAAVAAALSAGFRMGKGEQHVRMLRSVDKSRKNTAPSASDTNTTEAEPEKEPVEWSVIGFRTSLVLFILALLGFGAYYLGVQAIGRQTAQDQAVNEEAAPVDAATQALIDKAKSTGQTKPVIEVDTTNWKEYRDENNAFVLRYPGDYQFDEQAVGKTIQPLPSGTELPQLISTIRLLPVAKNTPALTISTYTNSSKLEPGSFSSLYQIHDPAGTTRSAFQLNGSSATKFSQTTDTERSEITYASRRGADQLVTLELQGEASVMTDPTLEWETLKTVAAKIKLR